MARENRVIFVCDAALVARVDEAAARVFETRSAFIRRCITQELVAIGLMPARPEGPRPADPE